MFKAFKKALGVAGKSSDPKTQDNGVIQQNPTPAIDHLQIGSEIHTPIVNDIEANQPYETTTNICIDTHLETVDYSSPGDASFLSDALNSVVIDQAPGTNEDLSSLALDDKHVHFAKVEGDLQGHIEAGLVVGSEPETSDTHVYVEALSSPMDNGGGGLATASVSAGDHDVSESSVVVANVEPLNTVMYLMEEEEGMDARSVVSDVFTEEELVEELQGLSRAITAIEEEVGLCPTSPTAAAAGTAGNNGLAFGTSPPSMTPGTTPTTSLGGGGGGGGVSTEDGGTSGTREGGQLDYAAGFAAGGASPYDLCRLYNDLGLRLMDAKDYEQALTMLRKAEGLVDNDLPWAAYEESVRVDAEERSKAAAAAALLKKQKEPAELVSTAEDGDATTSTSTSGIKKGEEGEEEDEEERANRRNRLKAITYNNLGCLFKRRGLPQVALGYLQRALIVSESSGQVHNCSSTLLNICAAYSGLKRYKEALNHAERAIVLLQRHLWGTSAPTFQDGINTLTKTLTTVPPPEKNRLLSSVSVLAMAYHNAAVEHERLGRWKEAGVSYARAVTLGTRFLGAKCPTTVSLLKAQKNFTARQQKAFNIYGTGYSSVSTSSSSSGVLKKAPGTLSSSSHHHHHHHRGLASGSSHTSNKRTGSGSGSTKRSSVYTSSTAARSGSSGGAMRMSKSATSLASLSKGTLPLDKAVAAAPRAKGESLTVKPSK